MSLTDLISLLQLRKKAWLKVILSCSMSFLSVLCWEVSFQKGLLQKVLRKWFCRYHLKPNIGGIQAFSESATLFYSLTIGAVLDELDGKSLCLVKMSGF